MDILVQLPTAAVGYILTHTDRCSLLCRRTLGPVTVANLPKVTIPHHSLGRFVDYVLFLHFVLVAYFYLLLSRCFRSCLTNSSATVCLLLILNRCKILFSSKMFVPRYFLSAVLRCASCWVLWWAFKKSLASCCPLVWGFLLAWMPFRSFVVVWLFIC